MFTFYFQKNLFLNSPFDFIFPEAEDGDFLTPEAQLDEHSPKATRTLFLGNLDKEISIEELKEKLEKYGDILVSTEIINPIPF